MSDDQMPLVEALPLRCDVVTLLTYLRDNRITGTQSLGNLPRKAVREVTARFVHPPEVDRQIGDRIYRLRSEDDVWPLYFLHTLAEVGELLQGGRSRRIRLTPDGEKFLAADPLDQVFYLFVIWWERVNWLIAYPYAGMGDDLPHNFQQITHASLMALPEKIRVPFKPYADRLIQETGLKWSEQVINQARTLLRGAVERMVINILTDFGAAKVKYREELRYDIPYDKLDTFEITSLGRGLLEKLYRWNDSTYPRV